MGTRYKYIHFAVIAVKPKTKVWGCYNNGGGEKLGEVRWYPVWRQYCFFPESDTVYSASCLDDISHFIKRLR